MPLCAMDHFFAAFTLSIFCLTLAFVSTAASASIADSEITSLPGFEGTFPSKHYGGYINVNAEANRTLYYYFIASEGDPVNDPVVLWMNGGPGCSSFDGWIYEHGPFNFNPGASSGDMPTLVENPYSWSKVANMLYVDSPAGVGMSYTNDFICGDLKTGADMHVFLRKWFTLYDQFQPNEFYISGESYAGIYVPCVAREVANGIAAKVTPVINLKGYYIGNGCTDDEVDGDAFVPFIAGHGLISFALQKDILSTCQGNYWNATGDCYSLLSAAYDEVDDLNIYDILEPCYHASASSSSSSSSSFSSSSAGKEAERGASDGILRLPSSFRELGGSNPRHLPVRARMSGRAWPLKYTARGDGAGKPHRVTLWGENENDLSVPCIDDRMATVFLNNPAVRAAIHALPAEEWPWSICTQRIAYYADAGSMLPIHRNLTGAGYRALIYSGDHDMCVPYTGSEKWTSEFGYPITDKWRPWYVDGQVAGYTQGYEHNLTFATILGAGHTVPEYKPAQALYFHYNFLHAHKL